MVGALLVAALALGPIAPAEAAVKGCYVVAYQNVRYCSGTIDQVKQSRYPVGQRVVLEGVSVTAFTATTETVSVGWPVFTPCPPGMFCGAALGNWYQTDLVVPWTGTGRPTTRSVIDLYGRVTTGTPTLTLIPTTWIPAPGCWIEYC